MPKMIYMCIHVLYLQTNTLIFLVLIHLYPLFARAFSIVECMFSVDVRPNANKYVENNFHLNSVFCVLNQKLLQKVLNSWNLGRICFAWNAYCIICS